MAKRGSVIDDLDRRRMEAFGEEVPSVDQEDKVVSRGVAARQSLHDWYARLASEKGISANAIKAHALTVWKELYEKGEVDLEFEEVIVRRLK